MSRRYELTDQEWEQIASLLSQEKQENWDGYQKITVLCINAMVCLARNGTSWRDLPECYALWNSVYSRFHKWIDDGILDHIFRVLNFEAELEELSLYASIVQVHRHSAGAEKGASKRNRTQSGWCQHQNPCGSRRL